MRADRSLCAGTQADYNEEEKAAGLADPAVRFAQESKSQRSADSRPPELDRSAHDGSVKHQNKLYEEGRPGPKGGVGDSIADPVV